MYRLVAQGNANSVYEKPDGTGIRVSKTGADPVKICAYWNSFWRPKLGKYMGSIRVVDDPIYGEVLSIDVHGSSIRNCEIVAEFKPKWLLQSSRAPENSRSCRTCAIKAMRQQRCNWCSLDIGVKHNLDILVNSIAAEKHRQACLQLLMTSDLIDLMKYWQHRLDTPETLEDCMSLRDCTVMIECHGGVYSPWIVDLDPKSNREKWNKIESDLQKHYLNSSSICRLSR